MNKRRFIYSLPFILLLIIAVAGWFATDYLGNKARQEIIKESQASALTLSTYVSSTFTKGATGSGNCTNPLVHVPSPGNLPAL